VAQADALLATFNALLRIARIETGAYRSAFAAVDLGPIANDVADLYEATAEQQLVEIRRHLVDNAIVFGDRELLAQALSGCDAVINLVGILNERGRDGSGFRRAHVELAQHLLTACREKAIHRVLQMSALNADPAAPSHYLRTKGEAENLLHGATDLAVTSFRPSVIFGPEDSFLHLFAQLTRFFLVLPLACPLARFQPVYVRDVAEAFVAALDDASTHGKRYRLCGPRQYTMRELVESVCRITGRRRLVLGLGERLSYFQARMLELSPVKLMTRDNLRSMQVPSVCEGAFPFGIEPAALEAVAPRWLAAL